MNNIQDVTHIDDIDEQYISGIPAEVSQKRFDFNYKKADKKYKKLLPLWRRILWPWLTKLEKQKSLFLAIGYVEDEDE